MGKNMTHHKVMQQALEFIEHCWRDVSLNDYSEAMRRSAQDALNAALDLPDVQPVAAPYGWIVTGNLRLFTGEYAESDAKNEAAHCGGTSKAVALFDAPQPVIAPALSLTHKMIDTAYRKVWSTVTHRERLAAFAYEIEAAITGRKQ
jgi:hypothetical protein